MDIGYEKIMSIEHLNILHLTNTLGIGGVEKIVYQICQVTKDEVGCVCAASIGGIYADKLENLGVKHYIIPDLSSAKLSDIIKTFTILKKIVKENKINIIHCHHRMAVLYAKILLPNDKIIYNNHTIYSDKAFFSHLVLKNIHIIADGVQAKNNVTNYFKLSDKNITIINNAVDNFDGIINILPEIQQEKKKGNFILVNSSRFHPQKGLRYFIEAAEKLIKKNCKISFFIIGDGLLRNEIIKQVEDLKLTSYIHFLGFRNDIKNIIAQCDALALTSVYEGLPLTPMEAFSVRKAVIATDIDGTREVVIDHYNGILVRSKDADSIAEGIYELYQNKELLKKLDENAYYTFMNKFSLKEFKQRYLEFYQNI